MLDAYTVKKAIPRVVIAVIAINLSIYICIAAIDITTIIGRGLHSLLVTPFIDQDSFNGIDITTNVTSVGVAGAIGVGALGGIAALLWGKADAFVGLLGLLWPVIILVSLIAIAVLLTLVIRQGLLIFLTVIAPIAIACYILPGTERYFRQWSSLFIKTLLVYPIIAAIFAMSNVLAAILLRSSSGGGSMFPGNYFAQGQSEATSVLQLITVILVLYAPLVLIPFSFQLAGGAMAATMNALQKRASNLGSRAGQRVRESKKDPNSFFGSRSHRLSNRRIQKRADVAEALKKRASHSNRGALRKGLYRGAAGVIGGVNAEARASASRAATSKLLNDQIATGRDEEIRGLTVNKALADSSAISNTVSGDGHRYSANGLRRINSNGMMEYQSLGGAWVKDADVIAGHNRWGNDAYAQQAALSYEMRKSINDEQIQGIGDRYYDLATKTWGMSEDEALGSFKGAAYENQNTHLDFKYMDPKTGQVKSDGFIEELYEKRGTYNISQLTGKSIKSMRDAHANASNTVKGYEAHIAGGNTLSAAEQQSYEKAKTQLQMHESIADNFAGQASLRGGDPSKGQAVPIGPTGGDTAQFGYSSGSAHVTDELKQYFNEVQKTTRERAEKPAGTIPPATPRSGDPEVVSPDPTSADGSDSRNQRRF